MAIGAEKDLKKRILAGIPDLSRSVLGVLRPLRKRNEGACQNHLKLCPGARTADRTTLMKTYSVPRIRFN